MRTGADVLFKARSVVAAQRHHVLVMVAARHAHRGTVMHAVARAIAVAGRIAVTHARTCRIAVVAMRAPGTVVRIPAVTAVIAIVRPVMIAAPSGHSAFLIGRIGRVGAGTAVGRTLVGVIILLYRIGQPLMGPAAAAGIAAAINGSRHIFLLARADISLLSAR